MQGFFIFLVCVGFTMAATKVHPRGCIYALEDCIEECPEGTYGYDSACSYIHPEPTCSNPTPAQDMRGPVCDYSACYCEPPTVRDEASNKCMKLEDCPKKTVNPANPVVPDAAKLPVVPKVPNA